MDVRAGDCGMIFLSLISAQGGAKAQLRRAHHSCSGWNWWARFASIRQLKPLETIEFLLDPALQILARLAFRGLALADPGPLLHQELPVLPVGLEIERGDDVAADQDRQREIAELAFLLRHISLEAVLVVEEQMRPLALDDQRIERREDVHERTFASGLARRILERSL